MQYFVVYICLFQMLLVIEKQNQSFHSKIFFSKNNMRKLRFYCMTLYFEWFQNFGGL